jgi:hypothetical protein
MTMFAGLNAGFKQMRRKIVMLVQEIAGDDGD